MTDVLLEFKNSMETTLSNLKAEIFDEIKKKYDDLTGKIEELPKNMPKSMDKDQSENVANKKEDESDKNSENNTRIIDMPIDSNSGSISNTTNRREFDTDIASNSGKISTIAGPVNRGNIDLHYRT